MAVFGLTTSVGGIETVMAQLLPRLTREFRIVVLDPYGNPDYARLLDRAGVARQALGPEPRRAFVGGRGRLGRLAGLARQAPWMISTGLRLRRWAAENKPAVVYFNQAQAAGFFPRFLPKAGPSLIYHAHGSLGGSDIRNARYLGRRFGRILAVSAWIKERLARAGADEGKISVVYNGVNAEEIRRRSAYGEAPLPERRPGEVVIVQVGVLTPNKGQHLAVEAMARLPKHATLWFCGDIPRGGDASYVKLLASRAAALGLAERVHHLGWRNDVPFVLAHADICLLPSAEESFGLALVEAMVLAKPCVGAAAGGIPEIIEQGRTGFVAACDAVSLAGALERLVGSRELREKMGRAGQLRADLEFGLARQTQKIGSALRLAA